MGTTMQNWKGLLTAPSQPPTRLAGCAEMRQGEDTQSVVTHLPAGLMCQRLPSPGARKENNTYRFGSAQVTKLFSFTKDAGSRRAAASS